MTQQRIIRSVLPSAGGYRVEVESTGAYTDGRSRFDRVYLTAAELRDIDAAIARRRAIDARYRDALAGVRGTTPVATTTWS